MSTLSRSPKSTVHPDDDRDMLESLRGLSIKGFQDCAEPNSNTPSSTNASLPTPPALKSSHVILASPERPFTGHNWYSEERTIPPPPNAPLLKDLDSFTEGTGQGSFDFPLTTGADDTPTMPFFYHPTEGYGVDNVPTPPLPNSLALDLLPSTDPTDAVLAWIEGISATSDAAAADCPSTPKKQKKRRRSFNQDDDEAEERPRRAWSPNIDLSFIPNREHREEEPLEDADSRAEPEAPG